MLGVELIGGFLGSTVSGIPGSCVTPVLDFAVGFGVIIAVGFVCDPSIGNIDVAIPVVAVDVTSVAIVVVAEVVLTVPVEFMVNTGRSVDVVEEDDIDVAPVDVVIDVPPAWGHSV